MVALNMGQYAHGNQPVQHAIYLYNYVGQPWKAQYHTRNVLNKLYNSGVRKVIAEMKITVRPQRGMYLLHWDFILYAPVLPNMYWEVRCSIRQLFPCPEENSL